MLKKLKYLLNGYSDDELDKMIPWINSNRELSNIVINEQTIDFITEDFEIKVKRMFDEE